MILESWSWLFLTLESWFLNLETWNLILESLLETLLNSWFFGTIKITLEGIASTWSWINRAFSGMVFFVGNTALEILACSFSLFLFSAEQKSRRRTKVWLVIKEGTASCVVSHDFLSFLSCSWHFHILSIYCLVWRPFCSLHCLLPIFDWEFSFLLLSSNLWLGISFFAFFRSWSRIFLSFFSFSFFRSSIGNFYLEAHL